MTQTQPQTRQVVEVDFDASAYTNTYNYTLLFSIKSRKFVKPVLMKHLRVWYRILEGTYLRLSSWGRRFTNVQDVNVELVRFKGRDTEILASWRWQIFLEDSNWQEGCPAIIRDFVVGRPGYHGYPSVDFSKMYSDEDIAAVQKDGICGQPPE